MPDTPLPPDGINWGWIVLAAAVPPAAGLLIAWPFWRKRQPIFGNIAATAVIFAAAVALILREYVELDGITQACLEAGYTCFPEPGAFTRFAIYAGIALVQIFLVFSLSILVDERIRRRDYAPEWR